MPTGTTQGGAGALNCARLEEFRQPLPTTFLYFSFVQISSKRSHDNFSENQWCSFSGLSVETDNLQVGVTWVG